MRVHRLPHALSAALLAGLLVLPATAALADQPASPQAAAIPDLEQIMAEPDWTAAACCSS